MGICSVSRGSMCTNKTKGIWQDWEHDLLPSPAWEALGRFPILAVYGHSANSPERGEGLMNGCSPHTQILFHSGFPNMDLSRVRMGPAHCSQTL